MDAYANYQAIFHKYIGPYGDFVGVNMTKPNYRPNYRTWFWLSLNLYVFVAIPYSMLTGDGETIAKNFMFIGLAIQVHRSLSSVSFLPPTPSV